MHDPKSRHGWLQACSLTYAAVPCFIFLLGWLKLVFALPLAVILALGVYLAIKSGWETPDSPPDLTQTSLRSKRAATFARYGLILLLVLFFVAFSGVGGYSFQIQDYQKHNAFLRDLTAYPWPLGYESTGPHNKPGMLLTYFAYYLPAALVGKWFGWCAVNPACFLWASMGMFLAVVWFLKLVKKSSPLYALLFLCFGGIDIIGEIAVNGWNHLMSLPGYVDYWGAQYAIHDGLKYTNKQFLVYGSNYTFLTDGPHHVLPAWILILMVMHDAIRRRSSRRILLLWALTPLASAFVAVGMVPFVVLALYETRCRRFLSFENLVAAPLLLMVSGLFLLSNNGEYDRGWLWEFQDVFTCWPFLIIFCLVEFGLYVVFRPSIHTGDFRPYRIWWYTAIGCLVLLPWYRIGSNAELMAKGGVMSLIVLQTCLAVTLNSAKTREERVACKPLVFLLLLGTLASVGELARGLDYGLDFRPLSWRCTRRIDDLEPKAAAAQLFADGNSFFWRVLAKPVALQAPMEWSVVRSWDFATLPPGEWEWSSEPAAQVTPKGFVVRRANNGTLLQLFHLELPAEEVGAVRATITVAPTGDSQATPVAFRGTYYLYWTTERDAAREGDVQPANELCRAQFHGTEDTYLAWAATEQGWRGTVCKLAIAVSFTEQQTYDFCIRRIEILGR